MSHENGKCVFHWGMARLNVKKARYNFACIGRLEGN